MKTYSDAGVDFDRKDIFLSELLKQIKFERSKFSPFIGTGHYSALVNFNNYLLAINTDGVGTKMLIADEMQRWDTVGIDAIAMNVNDTICVGAEPFAFVDYLIIRDYDLKKARDIGKSLNKGAKDANISIVGGETAVMPDMVNGTDLSGTALGYVKKGKEITGKKIKNGDLIIALKSSGLHSNGFTLVRKILKEHNINLNEKFGSRKIGDVLLTPTKIYVKPVLDLIKKSNVNGLANITGGGLRNLVRLSKMKFVIDNIIEPQKIFKFIQDLENIDPKEMYQTFNMGMGFMIIAPENEENKLKEILKKHSVEHKVVGYVTQGKGVYLEEFKVSYERY
ncbi:MAG: phosphoribosylformylglycinamidine cyclo-ligase [Thermoplasmata archaeon]|nr:phosphoribosylformylglycinamidine cyclo-ligase [Thermoplasmata archaeon]